MLHQVFEAVESYAPFLALVPLYISTLPMRKTLQQARSGKAYPQPLSWGKGD